MATPNLDPPSAQDQTPVVSGSGLSTPTPPAPQPYTPGQYAGAVGQNIEQQVDAETAKQQAVSDQSQRDVGLLGQNAANDQKDLEDHAKLAADHERLFQASQGDLKTEADQIGSTKIDPDHWWNSKDTGGKIAATIGLIAGGFGQGLQMWGPHGNKQATNLASETIDQAIKNDIDSQDKNIQNRWKAYSSKVGIADRQDLQDQWKIADKHAQWTLANQVVLDKLKQSAAMTADPVAKANLAEFIATKQQDIINANKTWGDHVAALAAAAQAKLEAAAHEQNQQDFELKRIAAQGAVETAKNITTAQSEAPAKAFETELKIQSEERSKAAEELTKHGSDWTFGAYREAKKHLADVDSRIARLTDQYHAVLTNAGKTDAGKTDATVNVIDQHGKRGTVPASRLQDAIKHGYKVAP